MYARKTQLNTIDNIDRKPCKDESIKLTVDFHNGSRYSYTGQTKKECLNKFKDKFGNTNGFVSIEWNIEGYL